MIKNTLGGANLREIAIKYRTKQHFIEAYTQNGKFNRLYRLGIKGH